ncbi:hypothetical protein EVAR_58512_1 [Eumeta japonica]|uniref:Uncharacterized protein n=1 Tax=Eumeta variegata TaxID=151549 RepID=A0A4C1YSP7_EUMVA|nr:hypothetical protein EVAR_58512_1 [Eumeta japonica]
MHRQVLLLATCEIHGGGIDSIAAFAVAEMGRLSGNASSVQLCAGARSACLRSRIDIAGTALRARRGTGKRAFLIQREPYELMAGCELNFSSTELNFSSAELDRCIRTGCIDHETKIN